MTFISTSQWVPSLSLERMRGTIDRQIKRIGVQAVLRSDGVGDRWCWMFFSEWTPRELMARLIEPMDRRAIISAIDLPDAPQFGVERLVTFVQPLDMGNPVEDETLQIVDPPRRIDPGGAVLCWDCRVRQ
jgi:hypothetical protein